jgi:hypothetical protein
MWAVWGKDAPGGSDPIASNVDFERDHLYRALVVLLEEYIGQPDRSLEVITV